MSESASPGDLRESIEILGRFATDVGRRWRHPNDLLDLVVSRIMWIESDLEVLNEESRVSYRSIPEFLRNEIGPLPMFGLAELAQAAVHIAGDRHDRQVPHEVAYVFAGLSTRAIVTFREITLLLEHGYAFGARARWRALSEILVVARVLSVGDRHTAVRYMNHRWVILARERAKTSNFEWDSDLPTPEIMKKRLCRRFGEHYAEEYGWAATVTKRSLNVSKPRWWHLTKIAAVSEHASRVQSAHHSVHGGDALGLLGTIDDGRGAFHAGGSSQGVLEVARDSIRMFREVMWALFENRKKYSGDRKIPILQAICEVHAFNCEMDLGFRHVELDEHVKARHFEAMADLVDSVDWPTGPT